MKRTILLMSGICLTLILISNVSAIEIRPMNQRNHPGLDNPYHPSSEGPNHIGPSDYQNEWNGISQLCEQDTQMRLANQGKNIRRFYNCNSNTED